MRRLGPVNKSFATPAVGRSAPSPSVAPSAEFRAHHTVVEPRIDGAENRPSWLVVTRTMKLLEAGRIGRQEYEAGLWWRRQAEAVGRQRTQPWEVRIDNRMPGTPPEYRLNAADQLRRAGEALGAQRVALLQMCVCDDMSWERIGRKIGLSDKTTKDRCAESLIMLARWLRREPVADPPKVRFRIEPRSW